MSYSWKNKDSNNNSEPEGGVRGHEPKQNVAEQENKREARKELEDRQDAQKAKSKPSTSSISNNNNNRKKRKKTNINSKEEKEDGELDDENESMEEKATNEYEDDDYDEYDMDDDSKTSHDDSLKKQTTNEIPSTKEAKNLNETASSSSSHSLSLPKSTDVIMNHSVSSSSPNESEAKLLASSEITNFAVSEQQTIKTPPPPPLTATHYEMQEEEDYDDDDDDDYCNNKRLKIDESEQINDETTSKPTPEASNETKKESEIKELESKQLISDTTEKQAEKETQLDLDQDNDSSSSMSSKSSTSTSSALTAISAISSDSLPISSTASSITSELKQQSTVNETPNQEVDLKSVSQLNNPAEANDLKVPPLKIIYSNSPGAHPYVKSDEQKSKRKEKPSSKSEDDLKLDDSPASNSRSKAIRTRVASPITTLPGGSPKTTPTRRTAAAGRSSPALSFTPPVKTAQSNTGLVASTSSPLTIQSSSANPQMTDSLNSTSVSSEMENVIRRKLRSHTRQTQQTDEPSRQLNLINKSPSPLTILNENANQSSTATSLGSESSHDQDSSSSSAKQTAAPPPPAQPNETSQTNKSDHSNDSLVDSSDSNTKEISNINVSKEEQTQSGRKKRNRQQQQQQQHQNENSTTASESEAQSNTTTLQTPVVNLTSEQTQASDPVALTQSNELNKEQQQQQQQTQLNNTHTQPAAVPQQQQQQQVSNCIKKFLDLRHDLNKRRDDSMETHHHEVKLPKNYQDFVLFKKNYLIRSNKDIRQSIPSFKPPNDMPEDLKDYFLKQEKERHELRVRHRIEQDKLIIFYEQEILRCFNNRVTSQSSMPFSFCSIVKDDEVYSTYGRFGDLHGVAADIQPADFNPNQTPINPEDKFLQSLESLKNKFQKLKEDLVKRQLNESDSLNAVQKMDIQSHIRELLNKYKQQAKNNPSICMTNYNLISQYQQTNLASFVPIVPVSFNKIDLFDVSQIYTANSIQTTNVQSTVSISS